MMDNKEKTIISFEPVIIGEKLWYRVVWERVDRKGRVLNNGIIDYYDNKSDALEFVKLCANHGIPKSFYVMVES